MKLRMAIVVVFLFTGVAVGRSLAQSPPTLTLERARAMAVQNHPLVREAEFNTQRVSQGVREARSSYFPVAFGSLTGADATKNASIAAGNLNSSSVAVRYSNGAAVQELLTDFGRTRNLVKAAGSQLSSAQAGERAVVDDAALRVTQAYFQALESEALLKVAQETVKARQVVADQVNALARSKLKAALDVSFANVNLADARLLEVAAENDVESSETELSAALGFADLHVFQLVDPALPGAPSADISELVAQAFRQRPELARERFALAAAHSFAKAEGDLFLPTLSALATAGETPVRQNSLPAHYAAAGFNVNIPIFNGRAFSARHAAAEFQAKEQDEAVKALEIQVARDVRTAWLRARTSYERLSLTQQLFDQARLSLRLATARYNLGLSSIVELTQAQLGYTQAEIEQTAATYEYQIDTARLQYEIGTL
jgi:outer membrane protein